VIERPPNSQKLDFDVVLERRLPDAEATWQRVQELAISVPLALEGPMTEVLQPAEHEDLHEAMVSTFGLGVVKWTGGRSPVRIRFDPRQIYSLQLEDTAIGASAEILRDGTPARRLDLWWQARPKGGNRGVGWLVAYEDVPVLMEADEADGRWQMRVRGDPAIALRAGSASSYWAGEFTVPLIVNEVERVAPTKDWWIESAE
jgi:hypothetical protein